MNKTKRGKLNLQLDVDGKKEYLRLRNISVFENGDEDWEVEIGVRGEDDWSFQYVKLGRLSKERRYRRASSRERWLFGNGLLPTEQWSWEVTMNVLQWGYRRLLAERLGGEPIRIGPVWNSSFHVTRRDALQVLVRRFREYRDPVRANAYLDAMEKWSEEESKKEKGA